MQTTTPPAESTVATKSKLPLFTLGIVLCLMGPGVFLIQMQLADLHVPWYLPILASGGVALMALSTWQRGGILRVLGLIVFAIFCGFNWYVVAHLSVLSAYSGPAVVGARLPAFTANRSNKVAFSSQDFADGKKSMLLFYRGHW